MGRPKHEKEWEKEWGREKGAGGTEGERTEVVGRPESAQREKEEGFYHFSKL